MREKQPFPSVRVAMWKACLTALVTILAVRASAQSPETIQVLRRDPAGHGLLCRHKGKTILFVEGTPTQMGTAHGVLLRDQVRALNERVVYAVGAAYSLREGVWFFDRMGEIQKRTEPHIPERFLQECDALSTAAGTSIRDGRYGNYFPELFHCSGIAVRGTASKNGQVVHARVLDYMRDIGLQRMATVTVFMPDGFHAWMTLGYAGFMGTVTAMNEKGVAVGEMGGRGEGEWDGLPMSFLLRDLMERAGTVAEALALVEAAPRTCEYYYVLSDTSRDMAALYCTGNTFEVLRPGQQHPKLPEVPEDTVFISGGDRARHISQRLKNHFGSIDVPTMIELIKRPVAMRSNLHNAVFTPESLDMWVADAGKHTAACDEPYVRVNLRELIDFYQADKRQRQAAAKDAGSQRLP